MRFSVEIQLSGNQPFIRSDYRRNILSLIKEDIHPNQSGTEIYTGIGAERIQGFGMLEIL